MKWMEFRTFMNEYFDDSDELRIAVDGDNPTIEVISKEDTVDDSSYPIIIKNRIDDDYFVWDHKSISDFAKGENHEV